MKRAFLFLIIISCAGLIFAQDIIVTKAGTNIEDITVVSVTAENVTYNQAGSQKSIASSEVNGILYRDGRYVTPPSRQTISTNEVTHSNDSWDIGDTHKQQSDTKPADKNRSASFLSPEGKTSQRAMTSSAETKEEKKRQKEAVKACATEALNAYIRNYEEIRENALQQGYNKTQANKLAKEEAMNIYMQTLEECKNGSSGNSFLNSSNQNSSTSSNKNW